MPKLDEMDSHQTVAENDNGEGNDGDGNTVSNSDKIKIADAINKILDDALNEIERTGRNPNLSGMDENLSSENGKIKKRLNEIREIGEKLKWRKVWKKLLAVYKAQNAREGGFNRSGHDDITHWIGQDRRYSAMNHGDISLPCEKENPHEKPDQKLRMVLSCDFSGSCSSYSKDILNMMANFPDRKYAVKYLAWASDVKWMKMDEGNPTGIGCGTNYNLMIDELGKEARKAKPFDVIVVFTDGIYHIGETKQIPGSNKKLAKHFIFVKIGNRPRIDEDEYGKMFDSVKIVAWKELFDD